MTSTETSQFLYSLKPLVNYTYNLVCKNCGMYSEGTNNLIGLRLCHVCMRDLLQDLFEPEICYMMKQNGVPVFKILTRDIEDFIYTWKMEKGELLTYEIVHRNEDLVIKDIMELNDIKVEDLNITHK